jgi:hypothetical protein
VGELDCELLLAARNLVDLIGTEPIYRRLIVQQAVAQLAGDVMKEVFGCFPPWVQPYARFVTSSMPWKRREDKLLTDVELSIGITGPIGYQCYQNLTSGNWRNEHAARVGIMSSSDTRLAFYFFVAMFPTLLLLLVLRAAV